MRAKCRALLITDALTFKVSIACAFEVELVPEELVMLV